jgi:ubiquinone biosynthesis protein
MSANATGNSTARNLRRWWDVQAIFIRYGFGFLVSKTDVRQARRAATAGKNGHANEIERLQTPERLRLMLQELGPTFIKLGQVVSSQSNVIPPAYLAELEKLQDRVPPFPENDVRAVLTAQFKQQPEYLFREFTYTPLAAASIGQVHTATLNDFSGVVVKVQRPGIQTQIQSDLAIMREVARGLESTTTIARNYNAAGVVEEFAASISKELDYTNEAANMDQLRKVLSAVGGVRAPKVYWDLVTSTVLTMENIAGVKINDLRRMEEAGIDRPRLANTFVHAMVQQILIDGFFHADVHPGNVFVELRTGDIVFLDVGMTGQLDSRQRGEIVDLLRGLGQRDAHRITQVVLSLGIEFKPVSADALERDINRLVKKHLSGSLASFSYAGFLSELLGSLTDNGLRVPSDLLFALKAIMQTEQIVRTLNPNFNITELAMTASNMVLLSKFNPATMRESVTNSAEQVLRVLPLVGDAVEQYVRDARSGRRTTRLDPGDMQYLTHALSSTANRFMLAVLLIGGMIASVLVMGLRGEGILSLLPIVGLIGFVATLGMSLVVVARILWQQWRGM